MKKNIFLFITIPCLTACATFQQQAFDWRGQNFDSYVLNYGVPSSQYTLQDGNNVYSFKTNCADTNAQEEILIIINSDNVIQEISRTAACPAVPPPPMPAPKPHYVARHIEPQPMPHAHTPKPHEHAKDKPAPKPQREVKPIPAPTPAPAPQKPAQDIPAPKPQPAQDTPAPKPQPAQEKPAPKPQEKEVAPKQNLFSNKPLNLSNNIIAKKDPEHKKEISTVVKKESSFSNKLEKSKENNKSILPTPKTNNTQKKDIAKTKTQKTGPLNLENTTKGLQALKR
jgi:Predicted membrane protein